MASVQPVANLENHFFIKSLRQKKDYQQKKLDKIAKYKSMKPEELLKEQAELLSKEEEVISCIRTIESYKALFIEGFRKNAQKEDGNENSSELQEKAISESVSLVNLFNSQMILNKAEQEIQDAEILQKIQSLKKDIETSHKQIFSLAENLEDVFNHQGFAKIFAEEGEQGKLLHEITKTMQDMKIKGSQFKKKNTEKKEKKIVNEVKQEVQPQIEEQKVNTYQEIDMVPLPVGPNKDKVAEQQKKKNYYRKQRKYDNREKKGEHVSHKDSSNQKNFQKKGETGQHKRPSRVQEKKEE